MWRIFQPVEIIFGWGESLNLGKYMQDYGLENALLIATPSAVRSGAAARIMNVSGGKIVTLVSDVQPNPTFENVDRCAAKIVETGASSIVAIGGGSAMDCAKAAALAAANSCDAVSLLKGKMMVSTLPIIMIPTTSGTASYTTAGAVLSDSIKREKLAFSNPKMRARLAIVDPHLIRTCPPAITASCGFDVLAHALDSMCNKKANYVTDALAAKSARLVFEYLERAYVDGEDKEAREKMAIADVMAGLAFSQTGTTASHACSYYLTAQHNIPHGEACAFTLDNWFRINVGAKPELNAISREIGFLDAHALADELYALKKRLGLRTTLAEIGLTKEELPSFAESCVNLLNMKNNVAPIEAHDIVSVFTSCA